MIPGATFASTPTDDHQGLYGIQLHLPAVQAVLRDAPLALGKREGCLAFVLRTLVHDGLHIGHRNRYSDALGRHVSFEDLVDPTMLTRLLEHSGARIFLHAIYRMERRLQWISGVKPQTALVWLLVRYRLLDALRLLWLSFPGFLTIQRVHQPLPRSSRQIALDANAWQGVSLESSSAQAQRVAVSQRTGGVPRHAVLDSTPGGNSILSRGVLEER